MCLGPLLGRSASEDAIYGLEPGYQTDSNHRMTTEEDNLPRISVADPERKRFTKDSVTDPEGCCGGAAAACSRDKEATSCTSLVRTKKNSNEMGKMLNQIPEDILNNVELNEMIAALPANYNFEIHKTVWQLRKANAKKVALQMPEGFHRYAVLLCDILTRFTPCEQAVIQGDVAYGACCIDDYSARRMGCDFIVHYGHSCLIPVTATTIPVMYVFVEINVTHVPLLGILRENFRGKRVALLGTVQYLSVLHRIVAAIEEEKEETKSLELYIPQIRPLSPGEVLGCTSPRLPPNTDALIFVADGRFHLEAAMIANPTVPAYRYDPFTKCTFYEEYDHALMLRTRRRMIERARGAQRFGVILGTLGRQGSPRVLEDIVAKLRVHHKQVMVVMMSEVRPEKLLRIKHVEAWVQTSCPRLSIDWNYTFGEDVPLLTPYELNVMLGEAEAFWKQSDVDRDLNQDDDQIVMGEYPMDFYATGDAAHKSGTWTPGYHLRPPRRPTPLKK